MQRDDTERIADARVAECPQRRARQIQAAIDHARTNMERRVTIDELASAAGMSKYHFVREFKRATGATPYAFLMTTRLERAKLLLRDGAFTIAMVASMAGFASQSHMTEVFRQRTGTTPGQYMRDAMRPPK